MAGNSAAGQSAPEDARERVYESANRPLCKKMSCEEGWTPGSSLGGDAVWVGRSSINSGESNSGPQPCRNSPMRRAPRRRSRLGRKAQAPGGLERLGVEGADLDRAAHIERHGDAVLGHRRADDARALRP